MLLRAGAHQHFSGALKRLAAFCADRRGVAAIEFAFIAPVLLVMYFVTMEVSQAIETSKKVGRVGSMVADLVAQQPQTVSAGDIDKIMQIAETTLAPYNRSSPSIVVTGIQLSDDATPKVVVEWSRKMAGGAYSAAAASKTTTTVPPTLMLPGTFLVRVESRLDYKPMIVWAAGDKKALGLTSAFDSINMAETYYLRPRLSSTIACTGCYD